MRILCLFVHLFYETKLAWIDISNFLDAIFEIFVIDDNVVVKTAVHIELLKDIVTVVRKVKKTKYFFEFFYDTILYFIWKFRVIKNYLDGIFMRINIDRFVNDLVDCLTYLSENGPIWLLTPKVGRDGHVEPSDIQDAAQTAGLSLTSTIPASKDWTATRLVARKSGRK